jgi:hypothetical protein
VIPVADDGLTGLFVTQFSTLLKLRLQQKTSLLRGRVMEGSHTGAKQASPLQLVDAMQMQSPAGRFSPLSHIPSTYIRRWVSPVDKEGTQLVDNFDQLKTPIDPKSQLVQKAAAACARQWDDEIIRAMTATATVGTDAGSLTTEAWDTTDFQIAADFDKSGTANGLTVSKLNEARRILSHYHAFDEDSTGYLIMGSAQEADLRNQAQVVSSDFNRNGGVLTSGVVTDFMGFKVIVSERLPTITDKNSNTNTRSCRVWVPSAMYLGIWQDTSTKVNQRTDLSSLPWQIYTSISFGATRTELGKIVEICAADTYGADITP